MRRNAGSGEPDARSRELPRVLHLFSNAKWTGPAEPALNLCVALRSLGATVDFACSPKAGSGINRVVETARDRGIEPLLRFHLRKHRHPILNLLDQTALRACLRQGRYDLVHCHLDNDHLIALRAARGLGIPVLRSSYWGEGFPLEARYKRMLAGTRLVFEPSQRALEHDQQGLALPAERAVVVANAVDVERFDPVRDTPDGRRRLGIPPDAFVFGIVARMQTHRHYTDLFEALGRLAQHHPRVRLVVVGRGTKQERVGFAPVRELGLEDRVHFSGFIEGEDYVGMLRAFDAGVFLAPGSDGTCRAVREMLAMGKPVVAADRGMLAEIISHAETGWICDGSPAGLEEAMGRLCEDRARCRVMGQAARAHACRHYSLAVQAEGILQGYEAVLRGA